MTEKFGERCRKSFRPRRARVESISQSIAESLKQAIRDSGRSVYQISKDSGIAQIVIALPFRRRDIRMATADKLARSLKMQLTTG